MMLKRYISMCDPNKKNSTHGGYLQGKIYIPGYRQDQDLYMRLSCVADKALSQRILTQTQGRILAEYLHDVANLSPLLLHNLRFETAENSHKKVRRNELELPIRKENPYLLYKISEGKVYLDNSLITTMEKNCIVLGSHYKNMNIVALTPNKRSNSSGITISDVIEEKLKMIDMKYWQWNHDHIIMFHDNSSNTRATKRKRKVENEEEYTEAEVAEEIKFFRVCVETFRDEGCTDRFAMADISKEIRNSATMIDIVACEPQKSELQGGVSILVACQGKSCKDVIPCFTVYDDKGNIQEMETEKLNQPDVGKIQRHANTLKFVTPPQKCCVVKQIREKNLSIKLLVRKESSESRIKLNFLYLLTLEDHPKVRGTCQDCCRPSVRSIKCSILTIESAI